MTEAKNNNLAMEQVRLIDIVIKIQEAEKLDNKFELQIVKELEWLKQKKEAMENLSERIDTFKYDGIFEWAIKRMSEKYQSQGDKLKSHCLNYGDEFAFYSNDLNLEEMIAYIDKKDKTKFDDFVLSVYPIKRNDIFEFEAVKLMLQHKIKDALEKFEQCPGSGDKLLAGDPFLIHINDCHDCDHQAPQKIKYTKLSFVKRMLELEAKIKNDPKNAAGYCFDLANGFYNITYFGNARLFYQSAISEYGNYNFGYDNYYS